MSMKKRRIGKTGSNTQRGGKDSPNSRRGDGNNDRDQSVGKKEQSAISQLRDSPSDGGVWSQTFETGVVVVSGYSESPETWSSTENWTTVEVPCDDGSKYLIKVKQGDIASNFILNNIPEDMMQTMRDSKAQIGVRAGTSPWVIHQFNLLAEQNPKHFEKSHHIYKGENLFDATAWLNADLITAMTQHMGCPVNIPSSRTGRGTRILPLYEQRRSKTMGTTQGFKMKNFELLFFKQMIAKLQGSIKSPLFLMNWLHENTVDGKFNGRPFPGFVLVGENTPDMDNAKLNRVIWIPADVEEEDVQPAGVNQVDVLKTIILQHVKTSFSAMKKAELVTLCEAINNAVPLFPELGSEPFFLIDKMGTKDNIITLINQLEQTVQSVYGVDPDAV